MQRWFEVFDWCMSDNATKPKKNRVSSNNPHDLYKILTNKIQELETEVAALSSEVANEMAQRELLHTRLVCSDYQLQDCQTELAELERHKSVSAKNLRRAKVIFALSVALVILASAEVAWLLAVLTGMISH